MRDSGPGTDSGTAEDGANGLFGGGAASSLNADIDDYATPTTEANTARLCISEVAQQRDRGAGLSGWLDESDNETAGYQQESCGDGWAGLGGSLADLATKGCGCSDGSGG